MHHVHKAEMMNTLTNLYKITGIYFSYLWRIFLRWHYWFLLLWHFYRSPSYLIHNVSNKLVCQQLHCQAITTTPATKYNQCLTNVGKRMNHFSNPKDAIDAFQWSISFRTTSDINHLPCFVKLFILSHTFTKWQSIQTSLKNMEW